MNTARKSGGTELPDGWRIVGLGEVAEVAFSNVDKRTVRKRGLSYSAITPMSSTTGASPRA